MIRVMEVSSVLMGFGSHRCVQLSELTNVGLKICAFHCASVNLKNKHCDGLSLMTCLLKCSGEEWTDVWDELLTLKCIRKVMDGWKETWLSSIARWKQ